MFKIIVAGGRKFDDYAVVDQWLSHLLKEKSFEDVEIVSGGALGADSLGQRFAENNWIRVKIFRADWVKHGKSAGPIRNRAMAEYADALVAFWDGKSRGTADMIKVAKKKGLAVRVVRYE